MTRSAGGAWPWIAAFAWTAAFCVYRHDLLAGAAGAVFAVPSVLDALSPARLLDYARPVAIALAFIAGATAVGRAILRLIDDRARTRAEDLLLGLGLGLGYFSMLGLALGLTARFTPIALRSAFAASVAAALLLGGILASPLRPASIQTPSPFSRFILIPSSIMLFGLFGLNLVAALGPEVFYDSLVYHLALPKLYLINGRLLPTPHNVYSGIPFNTEMLYGFGLALGGEAAAKLIPFALGLSTSALVFSWTSRYASRSAALLAVLLFYSSPMIAAQSWHSLVELNLCFYSLLALYCVATSEADGLASYRNLALVGTLAGLALGVKYNALPATIALLAVLGFRLYADSALPRGEVWKRLAFASAVAALLVAPWLLKNLVHYRNPVFPFFDNSVDWKGLAADAKGRGLGSLSSVLGLWDLVGTLWSREWSGIDSLGMGLILLLPWAAFWKPRPAALRLTLWALVIGWAGWTLSSRMPRFFIFSMPLLAILAAAGVASEQLSKPFRRFGIGLLLTACLVNCAEIFRNWTELGAWRVVVGDMSRVDYLERAHPMYPTPYFPAASFINENASPGSRVLFVGEARGYRCERDFIADSAFAPSTFERMVRESKTSDELRERMRRDGIDFIVVNRAEILRRGLSPFGGDSAGQKLFLDFVKNRLSLVFESKIPDASDPRWVQVYRVKGNG